jgi:hypothetical protein
LVGKKHQKEAIKKRREYTKLDENFNGREKFGKYFSVFMKVLGLLRK